MGTAHLESLKAMRKFARENLKELCKELVEWQDTSILCSGRMLELAQLCTFDDSGKLQQAERAIEREAIRRLTSNVSSNS